ncbi:AIR synthase family protein [Alkaliphilus serpentinus]|uniref:AIR synthase n=1 Tax=Alkaliphilus serpentinus TaxID=1482731 RepID=A0A833HNT6_9FIRM|nr:AIR synthase family protein [Alkaliphilus serpentinus]KAB3530024.1 AIR synthase [Alkaliphilus serpentinus]
MKVGKIPSEELKEIVFSSITHRREEVLVRPGIGEDCAVVDFGQYACVLSTDPITAAIKDIGKLAIHISCNDVASNGVEPLGIMMTILAPIGTTKEDLKLVMEDANRAASEINVEIIGGHTEITDAVNRMVISTTAIGKQPKEKMISTKGAQEGDIVVMTKHAGLEGASIIASDYYDYLKNKMDIDALHKAKDFSKELSVVKEGKVAGELRANSIHDVTEGGILGALWELAEASSLGIEVDIEAIPIRQETLEICQIMGIDPYRLISSGVMVMTIPLDRLDSLIEGLKFIGVDGTPVARIIRGNRLIKKNGNLIPLQPPDTDEIYRVFDKSYK